MERKTIEKAIGESLEINTDYYYGAQPFSIKELKKFLDKAESNGATHLKFSGSCYDGTLDDVDLEPVSVQLESDEDYSKRLAEEEIKKDQNKKAEEDREKALFEELRKKYGD